MLIGIVILVVASFSAWFSAKAISAFFFSDARAGAGLRPEFRYARYARREGDLKEAMKLVRQELEKDPTNYEGLLLLAAIHEEMKRPDQAVSALNAILSNPGATEAQKEFARAEQDRLHEAQDRSSSVPPPLPESVAPPPFPDSVKQ
jgi:tetratricopeptide (TPR) repeat protein